MKIVFISKNPDIASDFCSRLASDQIEATAVDYANLDIYFSNETASIKNHKTGEDLREYDKIIVIGAPDPLIHILSAVSCYCRKNDIDMLDASFNNCSGKLYEMARFWENGISIPKTAFGNLEHLTKCLADFGGIAVLKATHGTKGKDNYLIHSPEELAKILEDKDSLDYVMQEFIPNTGDYRIITFDYEPKLAIYRSSTTGDHRNNTSLGGSANIVDITPELAELSSKAAKALDIRFAGVDIITDKNTGKNYILEINRTPQFVSGAFIDEKYQVLLNYLNRS